MRIRVRLWKRELQHLAGLTITVTHLQVEPRRESTVAYIAQNWRGKPLVSPGDCSVDRQHIIARPGRANLDFSVAHWNLDRAGIAA
jgi:hypothetical protein